MPGCCSSSRMPSDKTAADDARGKTANDQVHRADILVIGGIDVAPPPGRVVGRTMSRRGAVGWREKVRLACRFEAHVHPIDQRRRVARTPASTTRQERARSILVT